MPTHKVVKHDEWLKARTLRLHLGLSGWRLLSAKARVNTA